MSTSERTTISVIVGPNGHGVVRHAQAVSEAARAAIARFDEIPTSAEIATLPGDATVAHLHYTDRVFGPDATTAAARARDLANRLDRRIVITLHDVPETDGTAHSALRAAAYRLVADSADIVVVASNHERDRLHRCGVDAEIDVIPLPIHDRPDQRPGHERLTPGCRTIGVLGFIYPGKGHDDVIHASAELPGDVCVMALGEASTGHTAMTETLTRLAERHRRRLTVTGSLDDMELTRALGRIDLPVVPAPTTSASGSLGTWIGAGRRPVVAANGYTREIAATAPHLMTLYDPSQRGDLAGALGAALIAPDSTWHDGPVPIRYIPATVGYRHRRLYHDLATRS